MKEQIKRLYEALEDIMESAQDLMQELQSMGGNESMGQRRGRRRSNYRDGNGSMGERYGMGQKGSNGSMDKEELWEALEEFMSQRYE